MPPLTWFMLSSRGLHPSLWPPSKGGLEGCDCHAQSNPAVTPTCPESHLVSGTLHPPERIPATVSLRCWAGGSVLQAGIAGLWLGQAGSQVQEATVPRARGGAGWQWEGPWTPLAAIS